jgi:hypothetical protein
MGLTLPFHKTKTPCSDLSARRSKDWFVAAEIAFTFSF